MEQTTDNRVALLYDAVMAEHETPSGHPERAERVTTLIDTLKESDVWNRLNHLPVRLATREDLGRVHSKGMIDIVERTCANGGGYLDADTYASHYSWEPALAAAGAAIGAVDAVMDKGTDAALAVVRPPGHHALARQAMGFCLFNNAAVAAAHAITVHGLERILLVDFDVHHGNGTQEIFYSDPRVLFFSCHQYPAYPGTGRAEEMGTGAGNGYTVNVPVLAGVGDAGYGRIFDGVLRPIADRYKPELVLVSAGYDAHWRNSAYVAGINERVTIAGFAEMSRQLRDIAAEHCAGRLAAVLEGGYDLDALGYGVLATLRTWLGDAHFDDPIGPPPQAATADHKIDVVIDHVRRLHGL